MIEHHNLTKKIYIYIAIYSTREYSIEILQASFNFALSYRN